jgi:hypothetical protein
MTDMPQGHEAALAALEGSRQTLEAARTTAAELDRAVKEQRAVVEAAAKAVSAAQVYADSFLPAVVIVHRSKWSGSSRIAGVILRRTDKTITVKHAGEVDASARQFRPNKYRPGVWTEYPAPKGYSSVSDELEFPGQADD